MAFDITHCRIIVPSTNEWLSDLHDNTSINIRHNNIISKQVYKSAAFHITHCRTQQLPQQMSGIPSKIINIRKYILYLDKLHNNISKNRGHTKILSK